MTPIRQPPTEYEVRMTAVEAMAARRFLLDAFRLPIREELEMHLDAAIRVFAKLTGIVEAAEKDAKQ
jgi:hypothetical protein